MQRKILNTKKVWSGIHIQSGQEKLHSIPIINKLKSNVLCSIPRSCVFALLLVGAMSLVRHANVYAWLVPSQAPATDFSTVTPISSTSLPATASLSLSKPNMVSDATAPGSTAVVNTNVMVKVANVENYSLTLKMDRNTLTNGSTTITAGNATTDNTWGYKWDGAGSYSAPSTTAAVLTTPALTNNAADFTKTLTFAAKFASTAESGHYKANGTLSLVATPKTIPMTLADLTQMQQLSLVPDACANTPYLSGQNYSAEYKLSDVRDNSTYTVRKFGDGKCWMTQNLKFINTRSDDSNTYTYNGRTLNSDTSDVFDDFTLPNSSTSGFSDDSAIDYYLSDDTGYFTWCAATAGTAGGCKDSDDNALNPTTALGSGQNATSSVCPKGWKLPTGTVVGKNTTNDFWKLFRNMELTISNDSLASTSSGSTNWGSGDLAKVQGSPYNFAYTGYMYNSSTSDLGKSVGVWWSRTASGSSSAYYLFIYGSYVYPGTANSDHYNGFAVRCVAQ